MLGLERVLADRSAHRPAQSIVQVLRTDADVIVRVGFAERDLGGPVVRFVYRIDQREDPLVLFDAFEDLTDLGALEVAGAGQVGAGGRHNQCERLLARSHAGGHGVVEIIALVLVILIDQGAGGAGAIAWAADHRLEATAIVEDRQIGGVDGDAVFLLQVGRAERHQAGRAEDLPGLLFGGRAGIDLGTVFVIVTKHNVADAGGKEAFAVLSGDLAIGFTESTIAGLLMDPAEERADDEALPGLEDQSLLLGGPAAFGVREQLDEFAGALGFLFVEAIGPVTPCEVSEMALARQAYPFAGEDLAGDDVARVGRSHFTMGIARHARPAARRRRSLFPSRVRAR